MSHHVGQPVAPEGPIPGFVGGYGPVAGSLLPEGKQGDVEVVRVRGPPPVLTCPVQGPGFPMQLDRYAGGAGPPQAVVVPDARDEDPSVAKTGPDALYRPLEVPVGQ